MRLQPNSDLSIRQIDREIFIYDRDRSLVHTFNETGAFLWRQIEAGTEEERLVQTLIDEYDVDLNTAARDVGLFLTTVRSLGLTVPAP
jgi:hypothetical protein